MDNRGYVDFDIVHMAALLRLPKGVEVQSIETADFGRIVRVVLTGEALPLHPRGEEMQRVDILFRSKSVTFPDETLIL